MLTTARRVAKIVAATAVVPGSLLFAGTAGASASPARVGVSASYHGFRQFPAPGFRVRQILNGTRLRHAFIPAGTAQHRSEPLASPDDITVLGHHLYVA